MKVFADKTNFQEQTICVFGDSIARGFYDPSAGGWVGRLRRYLEKKDPYAIIYNQSIDDETTRRLLLRFKTESEARGPDIIIFALGINDSQLLGEKKAPRVPLKEYQNYLTLLINQAKEFTEKIIFLGPTKVEERKVSPLPWCPQEKRFYCNNVIRSYEAVLKKVCEKNFLPFLSLFDLLKPEDLFDGLHPNSYGHQKYFFKVKSFLLENFNKENLNPPEKKSEKKSAIITEVIYADEQEYLDEDKRYAHNDLYPGSVIEVIEVKGNKALVKDNTGSFWVPKEKLDFENII